MSNPNAKGRPRGRKLVSLYVGVPAWVKPRLKDLATEVGLTAREYARQLVMAAIREAEEKAILKMVLVTGTKVLAENPETFVGVAGHRASRLHRFFAEMAQDAGNEWHRAAEEIATKELSKGEEGDPLLFKAARATGRIS